MNVEVRWLRDLALAGTTGSGHTILIDGPPDLGGRNLGPRPMELLLLGLGACASVDVLHILRKSRQDVDDCVARIEADRADSDPKVFTAIRVHFTLSGRNLAEAQVARAVRLSAEKYCSASIMLGKTAELSHSFEIREVS